MSFFKRLVGSGSESTKTKKSSSTTPAQAIEQLSNVEDTLLKRSEHLESQIEDEKKKAVMYSRQGNKRSALNALRRKKQHEKALVQIDGTLTKIEMQRESIQNATSNVQIFKAMTEASQALKKAHQGITAEDVEELMDELQEQHQIADEIATAISSPGISGGLYDDDELERELELLAAGEPIDVSELPDVPDVKIRSKETKDHYRELEAWTS